MIEKSLGERVPDWIWNYAKNKRMISQAETDSDEEDSVAWLVGEIRELIGAKESASDRPQGAGGFVPVGRRHRRDKLLPLRREVVSELIAVIARRRPEVQNFRQKNLRGRLLTHAEIEEWVSSRSEGYRYPLAVLVKLPRGLTPIPNENGELQLPPGTLTELPIEGLAPVEFIVYSRPEGSWPVSVPCGRDGVLHQLRSIAKDLVRLFGWQEAQATVFILSDQVPLLPTFGITVSPGPILMDEDLQLNCLTRISLTASPLSTPREVAKGYEKIRATVLKGKARALTEKHMHLAAYCASLFR